MPPDVNAILGALHAPPAPFVPEQHQLPPGYALLVTGLSGPEHEQLVARIRKHLPPLFEMVTPMPYVELQKMLDEGNAWGFYRYEKGTSIEDLSDEVIDVVTEHVPHKNSPMSLAAVLPARRSLQPGQRRRDGIGGGRSPRFGPSSSTSRRTQTGRGWHRPAGRWPGRRSRGCRCRRPAVPVSTAVPIAPRSSLLGVGVSTGFMAGSARRAARLLEVSFLPRVRRAAARSRGAARR